MQLLPSLADSASTVVVGRRGMHGTTTKFFPTQCGPGHYVVSIDIDGHIVVAESIHLRLCNVANAVNEIEFELDQHFRLGSVSTGREFPFHSFR